MKGRNCLLAIIVLLSVFSLSSCARFQDLKNQDELVSISLDESDIENIENALNSNSYEVVGDIEQAIEESEWVGSNGLSIRVTTVFPFSGGLEEIEIPEENRLLYIALDSRGEPGCRRAFLQIIDSEETIAEGIILGCKKEGKWVVAEIE